MAAAAAKEIGSTADRVLVSSTGVIGVQLPIEKIERGIVGLAASLQPDPMVGAEGIMTTDTHPKALSARVGDATITWVAKGSGMIEPNMATMLAYIFTDAEFDGLDACRENPFAQNMKRSVATRGITRGLARVDPMTPNTLIAFAAKVRDRPLTTGTVNIARLQRRS